MRFRGHRTRCGRTHNGRRRPELEPRRRICAGQRRVTRAEGETVCKTVGSAYVGSNPTPATTCENGPLAGNSRLCGPFLLCPVVCHLVALRAGVSRCPRTYSGRRFGAAITVGAHRRLFHGRPRTGRAGGVFRLDARRSVGFVGTSAIAMMACRPGNAGLDVTPPHAAVLAPSPPRTGLRRPLPRRPKPASRPPASASVRPRSR